MIDWFLCNSYPCVLFESLSHVINQKSHVYLWNLWKIYLVHFLKFRNLKISKFQESELGKFIPNFPLKHVITSTNFKIKLISVLITWLSEIFSKSLIALFWNFPLTVCSFSLLFSHSKNIRKSHITFGNAFRVQLYTLSSHFCNHFFVRRQFYQILLKFSGAFNLQLLY